MLTICLYSQGKIKVETIGGNGTDSGEKVCSDMKGNVYFLGTFSQIINVNGTSLNSKGGTDIILIKRDINNNVKWIKTFGSSTDDYALGLSCNSSGDIIVSGKYTSQINIDGKILNLVGQNEIFISKISEEGNIVWTIGTTSAIGATSNVLGITSDKNDNIVVTGYFEKEIKIGNTQLISNGNQDGYLWKLSTDGSLLWAKSYGTYDRDNFSSVVTDLNKNIYVAGYFRGSFSFGNITVSGYGDSDFCLLKFTENGEELWAKTAVGYGNGDCCDVKLDRDGNLIVCGGNWGFTNWSSTVALPYWGGSDICVAKYDKNGSLLWAKAVGGEGNEYAFSVCCDKNNNIYAVGYSNSSFIFNHKNVPINSAIPIIIQLDSLGNEKNIKVFENYNDGTGYFRSSLVKDNELYLTGYFKGNIIFDTLRASKGDYDAFYAKIGLDDFRNCITDIFHKPQLFSVQDVPNDEGGNVRISFIKSKLDSKSISSTDSAIVNYSVWRKNGGSWDALSSFNAIQDSVYNYVAPTLSDYIFTGSAIPYYTYRVIAHTKNPAIYYISDEMSGYSIDNIAPSAPANLLAVKDNYYNANVISWEHNKEKDFKSYFVYRSEQQNFVASELNKIAEVQHEKFTDYSISNNTKYYYKVVATDVHYNMSNASVIATILGNENNKNSATKFELMQNYPNPFNPSTTIRYSIPEQSIVEIRILNPLGQEVYLGEKSVKNCGIYSFNWNAGNLSSGVYYCSIKAKSMQDGKIYNNTKKMILMK